VCISKVTLYRRYRELGRGTVKAWISDDPYDSADSEDSDGSVDLVSTDAKIRRAIARIGSVQEYRARAGCWE
jgi:hypothetical protein